MPQFWPIATPLLGLYVGGPKLGKHEPQFDPGIGSPRESIDWPRPRQDLPGVMGNSAPIRMALA